MIIMTVLFRAKYIRKLGIRHRLCEASVDEQQQANLPHKRQASSEILQAQRLLALHYISHLVRSFNTFPPYQETSFDQLAILYTIIQNGYL